MQEKKERKEGRLIYSIYKKKKSINISKEDIKNKTLDDQKDAQSSHLDLLEDFYWLGHYLSCHLI